MIHTHNYWQPLEDICEPKWEEEEPDDVDTDDDYEYEVVYLPTNSPVLIRESTSIPPISLTLDPYPPNTPWHFNSRPISFDYQFYNC